MISGNYYGQWWKLNYLMNPICMTQTQWSARFWLSDETTHARLTFGVCIWWTCRRSTSFSSSRSPGALYFCSLICTSISIGSIGCPRQLLWRALAVLIIFHHCERPLCSLLPPIHHWFSAADREGIYLVLLPHAVNYCTLFFFFQIFLRKRKCKISSVLCRR